MPTNRQPEPSEMWDESLVPHQQFGAYQPSFQPLDAESENEREAARRLDSLLPREVTPPQAEEREAQSAEAENARVLAAERVRTDEH